ncbi:MAG: DNA mismatch repair protein MutS, partial [Candidatus Egerieousia sp.]|nr:DNA mismatch repair protein MutS [bacterium]MDY5256045.1 DNA mismatch repair protein MutS [Candidatus Egerieousia sp.]
LLRGLSIMGPLKSLALEDGVEELATLAEGIETFENLRRIIGEQMMAEPASLFGKGDIIANGVDAELDDLRRVARHSKEYLLNLQQQESERSGITSLKVGYNNIFGYYLEVRNTHKDKVPAEWIRKQTLVNAERYITQELKEYEEKILGAEEKILAIEQRIYASIVAKIQQEIRAIQQSSAIVAQIDLLSAFAQLAVENNYSRPIIDQSLEIEIRQGRHPVIERNMPLGQEYVANDIKLDSQGEQIIILTGPNMAGKSALLRQTALIVLMAQTGSFVPAAYARIGIVDKVFTRVGASDNISKGESTFMVEMTETSTILHNLSPRSLVLLDEIGRGTSTFDGMSIAWAIVEYIHQNGQGAKTLFATHYHELNELEERYPRIKNYHIAVKEVGNSVIFLRKLLPGGVAHSFGIHVARMAGMPMQVVESAQRILAKLESERGEEAAKSLGRATRPESMQLTLFQLDDPLLLDIKDKLMKMDINTMSPLDAFDALRELKRQMGLKV